MAPALLILHGIESGSRVECISAPLNPPDFIKEKFGKRGREPLQGEPLGITRVRS